MPKVSIILPVYNSEKYISKTINSILNQTFKDWELIIVDDASTDKSIEVINELKTDKFIISKNDKNLGAAASRNKAIKLSRGRYIAFIDSDDIWKNDKLEKQIKFMENKNVAFSFSSYERIRENEVILGFVNAPCEVTFNDMLKSTPIQISTVVLDTTKIKKDLIKFDIIRTCEDIDFYLKILNSGIVANGIEEILVKYQVRKHSLSSNRILNTIRRWAIYKKYNLAFRTRFTNIMCHIKNSLIRTMPFERIKRLKEILSIMNFKQVIDVVFFPLIYIISLFSKILIKNNIWLIEENPNEACDNGYILFKYIREYLNDINIYYVINKKSKDFNKVKKIGRVINHGSLKHWIYYLHAEKILVTQKYANPSPAIFYILHKFNLVKVPRIFLQHGVIKDDCKMFYYNRTKFRLFICGAKREYESIEKDYGYPPSNVVYTGLARFDNLNLEEMNEKEKLILVAPTWRKWIKTQKDFNDFMQNYYNLISNDEIISLLSEKDIKLQLVLHKNMRRFKLNKNIESKNVLINHNYEVDIQELLNKTNLLITDYSSIFMDIAYRQKPIIYYQFDENDYRKKQLQEGYFSYEEDGFGDILKDENEMLKKIKYYDDNNFEVEEKYLKRMNDFFEIRDKNNCKRILEQVEKI